MNDSRREGLAIRDEEDAQAFGEETHGVEFQQSSKKQRRFKHQSPQKKEKAPDPIYLQKSFSLNYMIQGLR